MTPKADKPLSVRPTKPATAPRTSPAKRAVPPSAGATRSAKPTVTPTVTVTAKPASALPPAAAAAGAFVGDLQAGVADGQVAQPAGQDLFTHLQQALFGPPGPAGPAAVPAARSGLRPAPVAGTDQRRGRRPAASRAGCPRCRPRHRLAAAPVKEPCMPGPVPVPLLLRGGRTGRHRPQEPHRLRPRERQDRPRG